MKRLLPALILLGGCAPSAFDQSRDDWEAARDAAGDRYTYVRYDDIIWYDVSWEKTVTVRAGVITQASYHRDDQGEITDWTEVGDELGSHGEHFQTIDQIYDECEDEVLPKIDDRYSLKFDTFADGILEDCFYVDESDSDYRSTGISLRSVTLEP